MRKKINRIVLISPKTPLLRENPEIYNMFQRNKDRLKPWLGQPLNLLTIAALTPGDIEIRNFYNLVFKHEKISKNEAQNSLISLHETVFSDENTSTTLALNIF